MKRIDFLKYLATGTLAAPVAHGEPTTNGLKQAEVVTSSGGRKLWVLGMQLTLKADSQMTGGAYAIFENVIPPGRGVPLHVHTREDETLYVLEGDLQVVLGEKTRHASTGDFVNMPRGIGHRFQNVGNQPARLLLSFCPGGMEQMFIEIGTPIEASPAKAPEVTPDDIRKARTLAVRYGGRWL